MSVAAISASAVNNQSDKLTWDTDTAIFDGQDRLARPIRYLHMYEASDESRWIRPMNEHSPVHSILESVADEVKNDLFLVHQHEVELKQVVHRSSPSALDRQIHPED